MKRGYLIILLLTFVCLRTRAIEHDFTFKQDYNSSKDELVKQYRAAASDTARLNTLNNLVFYFPLVEDPGDIDTVYLNKLITLDQSIKAVDPTPYITLRAALRKGVANDVKSEQVLLEKTVEEFDAKNIEIPALLMEMRYVFNLNKDQQGRYQYYSTKLSGYLVKSEYTNAAVCYHCLAGYYVYENDLNSAINNYLKATELFKAYSNLWYAHDFGVIGSEYSDWGNNAKGLFYLNKALYLEKQFKITGDIIIITTGIAETEYQQGNYNVSLKYLEKLDDLNIKKIFPQESIAIEASIADTRVLDYIGLGKLNEAKNQLQIIDKLPSLSGVEQLLSDGDKYARYKYYLAINDRPKAEKNLLICYQIAVEYAKTSEKINYSKDLANFYADENNLLKAWKYTVLYNQLSDSLQKKMGGYNVASYENEQKENTQDKKLLQLQQQRAIQDATIGQRNMIIWISLIGLLLVAISLIFIYRQLQTNRLTLKNLKITQTQLIQSEKMASLGELTAGIAHEIQNPLNFVNNFSEVNTELLDEMQQEIEKGDLEEIKAIAIDIQENEKKINHHGKRADFIVKGMLLHSRNSSGEKELTNINVMANEFFKLSYQGLRAKDKNFNAELVTHFDKNLPDVNVAHQDIGRVLLNLFNNAFYAVNQKQKTAGDDYKPEVTVTTLAEKNNLVITVKDNGNGIPDAIKDKIMQPFFTTKPTGEGTGLGLSLSYDIVVKGHGGSITVDTKEGEFTEFTIILPIS